MMKAGRYGSVLVLGLVLAGCGGTNHQSAAEEADDPAQIAIGERLFKETRFAQFFATHTNGDVNAPLTAGDPAVATEQTLAAPLPGPVAGQTMNCAQCHLVDQLLTTPGGGMRSYVDFARRSPLTVRSDGQSFATRNSPSLVNASLPRPGGLLFHFDGEFTDMEQLTKATLTGRMQGWLPGEQAQATALIAKVIREDDGSGALAQEFGGRYQTVLQGTDRNLPEQFRLPEEFRVDPATASDAEIVDAVVKLISAYVTDLAFAQDDAGAFSTSPYDRFLAANILPRTPANGESGADYSRRLLRELDAKSAFNFIRPGRGNAFQFHPGQEFAFGEQELRGLKLFLTQPAGAAVSPAEIAAGHIGNCAACHIAPDFTDFGLHNNGVTQAEYEAIHGAGSFAALPIPGLVDRTAAPAAVLPATIQHPDFQGRLRSIPLAGRPELTDLGAWSIFANADFPASQPTLHDLLCRIDAAVTSACADSAALLDRSIATFKTAGLRDLGHSAPYMHTGQFDNLAAVLDFYQAMSARARIGQVRNADPRLGNIVISPADAADIAAFLRALNEDYS